MTGNVYRLTVAHLALVAVAATAGTCGNASDPAAVGASVEVTYEALSANTIQWIDGTYGVGCADRSGAWSVRVSGGVTMDYPALSVVKNNTACVLTLTKVVADQSYTGSPAIALTTSYAGSASTFTGDAGVGFYANAQLSSASFASSFTVSLVYSDNPNLLTGSLAGAYASVSATSTTAGTASPNYTLDLTTGAFATTVSATTSSVQSVSGTANLVLGTTAGEGYYVDQGTLPSNPTLSQLDSAYSGATKTTISGSPVLIPASAFGLTGVNISSAIVRTIVIQHNVSGVHSYQTFAITFGCAGACGTCPSGESSKADSSGMGAANVCCASAATTLNCNGTCANTLVDSNNCGSCGHVCSGATPHCAGGSCVAVCPTGSTLCSGICVNTATDNGSCGSCGNACAAVSYCAASQCNLTCSGNAMVLANSLASGTYEITSYAGYALDDPNGGGSGTSLDQWAYIGANQQWTVTNLGNGTYKILAANGYALTRQGSNLAVKLAAYTGAGGQLFTFVQNGSSWNIINPLSCDALDDSSGGISTGVVASSFNANQNNQLWTLTLVSGIAAPLANGTYNFANSAGTFLDDPAGGGAGTVPDNSTNTGANQQWTVTLVSGVQYKILAANGTALTMSSTPNTNIAGLAAYTGASTQLWVFWPMGSGAYSVINVSTGMVLDSNGGGAGAKIRQWAWTSANANQLWTNVTDTLSLGLVANYLFDETSGTTSVDSSGHYAAATLTGATFTSGLDGNAVTMNGTSSQYATLPTGIVSSLTDFSISIWVYLNAAPSWVRLFDFGTGQTKYMYLTANDNTGMSYTITTSGTGGEQWITSSTPLTTGGWRHVAVTMGGSTVTLYVNGANVGQSTFTLTPSSLGSTNQNWLGRSEFAGDPYLDGRIDNFRIYNRALSSAEVGRLYTAR